MSSQRAEQILIKFSTGNYKNVVMKLNFSPQWMIWATTVHQIQIFEFKTFVTLAFTAQEQGIYEDASKSWDKR
jgi:hypothetical protein